MGKAARKLSGSALSEWRAKHPFDPATGRFVSSGGSVSAPSAPSAPATPTAGRARARLGLASKTDMGSAMQTLRAKRDAPVSGDREAVDAILAPMTHKQLDEVAREFGMDSFVRGTKEQKARQLREGIVGGRLDHDAIMRTDLSANLGQPTRAEADAAFARIADINQRGAAAEASGAKPRRRARAALAATAENPLTQLHQADLKQRLTALASERDGEQQAEAMLSGLSLAALKDLSVQIGPTAKLPSKVTKAQAVHRIIEGTIGFRQRSEGIARGSNPWADRLAAGVTSSSDVPKAPAAPKGGRARAKLAKVSRLTADERAEGLTAISGGENPWAERLAASAARPDPTGDQFDAETAERNQLLAQVERLAKVMGQNGSTKRKSAARMSNEQLREFVSQGQAMVDRRRGSGPKA